MTDRKHYAVHKPNYDEDGVYTCFKMKSSYHAQIMNAPSEHTFLLTIHLQMGLNLHFSRIIET